MIQQICMKRRINYKIIIVKNTLLYDVPITGESLNCNFKNIERWAPAMSFIRAVNDILTIQMIMSSTVNHIKKMNKFF